MTREFTYADSGVDRQNRAKSKKALEELEETYRFSRYGKIMKLPYGNIFPITNGKFLDYVIEGIGTKVLVAQLANKYDTIGIDGVAMAVNDVIRSGATPLAITDNIHAQVSNYKLINEWMKGIVKGSIESECIVPNGEIGDVEELIKGVVKGKGFDIICSAIGIAEKDEIITGKNVNQENVIIGLRSSGIHSNGISLARKILFKKWGGKYEPHEIPDGLNKEVINEVLEPTKIYVKPLLKVNREFKIKATVHITGDAYLKFKNIDKFSKGIGFEFNEFNPHPIFDLIQRSAHDLGGRISDEELFKTFNMGWGFAIIVDKRDGDEVLDLIENTGVKANKIGRITSNPGVKIIYKNKEIILN